MQKKSKKKSTTSASVEKKESPRVMEKLQPVFKEMSLIAETHWDREWYSTLQEFRFRLVKCIDKLLDILDTTPYVNFLLDGQTITVEDYIEVRPENCMKIIDYAKKGRISIGPSYILPDIFLISGEAHIRNLLLGHKLAEEWGVPVSKTGYEPDAFGHIAQMPQIMQGFGINNYVHTRGMGDNIEQLGSEFWWEAPDGTRVMDENQILGYGNLADLLHDQPLEMVYEDAKKRVLNVKSKLLAHNRTGRLCLWNGVDHLEPEREIPKFIERFNKEGEGKIVHRSLEEHTQLQYQDLRNLGDKVPVWKGELHFGRDHPILTDTSSARMYLKQTTWFIEALLENWTDPMNALATLLGGKNENPSYIWLAWKSLLQNFPHDSICGCSVDEVHSEMETRFLKAEEIANVQLRRAMADLAGHISFYPPEAPLRVESLMENIPIIIFNPLPYEVTKTTDVFLEFRDSDIEKDDDDNAFPPEVFKMQDNAGKEVPYVIDEVFLPSARKMRYKSIIFAVEFMARVPAMGYAVYYLIPSYEDKTPTYPLASELVVGEKWMENKFIKVEFANNGTFKLTEKSTGRHFDNCMLFIDEGDCGDEYDFVPLNDDKLLTTIQAEATISLMRQTPSSITFEVIVPWQLPDGLSEDRLTRTENTSDIYLRNEVTLYSNDPVVSISTTVENLCEDHRLRVAFPTGIKNPKCLAKEPFHVQERSFNLPKGDKWNQRPSPSDHNEGFVTLEEETGTLQFSVFHKGMPNYEILSEGLPKELEAPCIIQTLFRATGFLGHPPLTLKDGKKKWGAGPTIYTPDAQMLDEYTFEYGVYVSAGNYDIANVPKIYQSWAIPIGSIIPLDYFEMMNLHPFPRKIGHYYNMNRPKPIETDASLPRSFSFMAIKGEGIQYSTLKSAEKGNGLILRIWNSSRKVQNATVELYTNPKQATLCRLDENIIDDQKRLSIKDKRIQIRDIRPSEIVTLNLVIK